MEAPRGGVTVLPAASITKCGGGVAGADAAHISDVVVQRGQDGVGPIAGCHDPLDATAAQNVLDAKGDQGRVFAIVIERVAAGDALDDETGGFVQGGGNNSGSWSP